jgi:hypothetical protein
MLDALANGSYMLHLSGSGGLTDLGGNPIAGNDLSGDYVIPFQVQGTDTGISGNMTDGYTVAARAGQAGPQNLGVLFPDELEAGVTIVRSPQSGASLASSTTEDTYRIQLLQSQNYSFNVSSDNLPAGTQVTLSSASGQSVPLLMSNDGHAFFAPIVAGTYTVTVSGWTADQSASIFYHLTMVLVGQQDNAPPLVDGPAPALQIHLDGIGITTETSQGSSGSDSTSSSGDGSGATSSESSLTITTGNSTQFA